MLSPLNKSDMKLKIKDFIISHWGALACAIFVSILVVLPQILFRIEHKVPEQSTERIELLPDSPWSPRVREIQDGHSFGNIYNKQGKDNPYLFQPLGSMIVAYMGMLFSLGINNTILLSRIVLPFVVFLLIYWFALLLSRDKLVSIVIAAIFLLADPFLTYTGISSLIHGVSPESFLRIARPVNPAMIYVFFFGFLIYFWKFFKEKRLGPGVIGSVLLSLNFYNYFYSWTYLYAFGGFFTLFLIFQKRWREALEVGSVYFFGAVLAIPYFINLYRSSHFPAYEEVGKRLGIIMTHQPLFVGTTVIFALIIFYIFFPKDQGDRRIFGLALLVTPFLTMNQQILTGKIMQADHYHWFFHKPIAVLLVVMTLFFVLERRGFVRQKKILAIGIILVSIVTGTFVQIHSYWYERKDGGSVAVERQKYAPVMAWLNAHGEKEEMVLGNDETSHLTVIYTPLNVLFHRAVCCTTLSATDEQMLDTVFLFYRIRGVGVDTVNEVFERERGFISTQIYGIYYRKLYGDYEAVSDEKINEIIELYKKTLTTPSARWIEDMLSKYEIKYIVWDKKNDPDWALEQYMFLKKAAVFGDIVIYTTK